ncbi:hypothetical protein [Polynucleobacter sp. MWH-UH23A]|uniref:hypothetical protein n=1 Tax=Polynucleobacter sp. MWH-UH23A TaxID=1855613 RepID=UPI003364CD6A
MGLTTMPTPKVARLARRPALGSLDGKNNGPKMTAKLAKVRKSYHSKKVPKHVAIATFLYEDFCLSSLPSDFSSVVNLFGV